MKFKVVVFVVVVVVVVVVVDTGHQCVRVVQIMRWCYSNLRYCPLRT